MNSSTSEGLTQFKEGRRAERIDVVKLLNEWEAKAMDERERAAITTSYLAAGAADQRALALRQVRSVLINAEHVQESAND